MTPPDAKADKNGWMPIETAPKGQDVLVFCPDASEPSIFRAAFLEFDGDPDPGDWYLTEDSDNVPVLDVGPTHWQPLPSPPVEGG